MGNKIKYHTLRSYIDGDEVVKISSVFFKKPYKNQRMVLLNLIWWSLKYYVKILFK